MNVINLITMKQVCLILAILILPIVGFGQFIGDTVIVYVDNRVEIKVAVEDYEELKKADSIQIALTNFKEFIPQITDQLSSNKADFVKYSIGGELTVEEGDSKIIYLNNDGNLSNTGFRDHAIINGDKYKIFITTSDLSKLIDLDLANCMKNAIAKLPEQTHWPRLISYECKDNAITELENKNMKTDFLELQFGAGAGLIKSKWVADLSFGVSLGLNHKGMMRTPYISANMVFDFDLENDMSINTFLNVGYSFDISRKEDKPSMLGFDLGYLIVKQGEMFGENTFKLGATWSPAKHINVSPQLFITDNFKQAFPGIRIGFGF